MIAVKDRVWKQVWSKIPLGFQPVKDLYWERVWNVLEEPESLSSAPCQTLGQVERQVWGNVWEQMESSFTQEGSTLS